MLSISRSIETTFLYIANVLISLVRNNLYCIFSSLYFTIFQNGISRNREIFSNAVMSNCFIICGKGEFAFLYHLLQRKYSLPFSPFAVFWVSWNQVSMKHIGTKSVSRSFYKSPFTDFNFVIFLVREIAKFHLYNHSSQETQISIFQEIKMILLYVFIGIFLCLNAANL